MPGKTASAESMQTAPDASFGAVLPWILFASLVYVINYLTRACFGPLLPGIESELAISHVASTRFILCISIGYTTSMFFSGAVCSVVRPRVLVAASLIFGGIVFQGIAVTRDILGLSLLFVLFGLVSGQYFNAGMSVLRGLVQPSQWSRAVSINELGPNIGFILAPLAAEFGAIQFGWRGTVSCLGWLSVAIGLLFLFFGKGGDHRGAPISFAGYAKILPNPKLWLFAWFIGLAIAGQFAPFSVMTLHMVNERALGPELAAFLLSASRVATPAGALVGGILTVRFGTRKTLISCFTVYALSLFAMSAPFFYPFAAGLFIQPLFTAMVFPALFTMLTESFSPRRQPMLIGVGVPIGSFFGIGLMPGALGMFGDHLSFAAGFFAMGCAVACSLALLRFLPDGK